KVYGADDPSLAGITPGLNAVNRTVVTWDGNVSVNDGGNVSTTLTGLTRQVGEGVGSRNITGATFAALGGSAAGNYQAAALSGTPVLTITPAPLTGSLPSLTKVYGDVDPVPGGVTVSVGGVVNRTASTWNGNVAINDTGNVLEAVSGINRVAGQNVGVYNIL